MNHRVYLFVTEAETREQQKRDISDTVYNPIVFSRKLRIVTILVRLSDFC